MWELIRDALRNLFRRRGRAALTVGGIAVGVLLVSLVSVVGDTGKAIIDAELDNMGVGGVSVMTEDGNTLLSQEALQGIRQLSCVSSAMPLMIYYSDVLTVKNNQHAVLCGIDAGAGQVISLELVHGRMIARGDVEAAAAVCVLDEATAKTAYGRSNVVGKTVEVQVGNSVEPLEVIGVTETGSSLLQNFTALIPGMVYIPYTTQQLITGQENFDQIAVRTVGGSNTETAQQRIEKLLNRLYDGNAPFRTDNLAVQKDRLTRLVNVVAQVLTVLSAVSLVVSGFGIMTAMLSAVSERTREIGVKKAIGATQERILAEFLTEAVLLSLAGAVVGMLPAVLLVLVLRVAGVTMAMPLLLFVELLGFSVLVGVVFGVYPAYQAAKMRPVEALRSE